MAFFKTTKSTLDPSNANIPTNETAKVGSATPETSTVRRSYSNGGVITSIINRIAGDVSAYDINYHRIDTSIENGKYTGDGAYLHDKLDPILERMFAYKPNNHQTPSDFLRLIAYNMLKYGTAVVFFDSVATDGSADNFSDQLFVGKLNGEPQRKFIKTSNGNTSAVYYVDVEYQETIGRSVTTVKRFPLTNVALLHNPRANQAQSINYAITALNNQIDNLNYSVADGKTGEKIFLKNGARNTLSLNDQNAEDPRLQKIAKALASSDVSVIGLAKDEEIVQYNTSSTTGNIEAIEKLTSMVHNMMGVGENIVKGKANDVELAQYRSGTISPIIKEIERGLTTLLGYNMYKAGHRISVTVNALSLLTPEAAIRNAMSLINSTVVSPDDFNAYALGIERVGGASAMRFNRNNKAQNAVTDSNNAVSSPADASEDVEEVSNGS